MSYASTVQRFILGALEESAMRSLWTLALAGVLAAAVTVNMSCGGNAAVSNPSSSHALPIQVALTSSATAIDASQSDSLAATVKNDPNNRGVKWTITCINPVVAACGHMAKVTSASGEPNAYIAPSSVSAAELLTVTAASAAAPRNLASVSVTVNPAPTVASSPPPQTGNVGQYFSLDLTPYVQGGTPPYTWSIKSGTLPAGLNFDPSVGLISGVPTAATASAVRRRLQIDTTRAVAAIVIVFAYADSGIPSISVSLPVSITINPALPLAIRSFPSHPLPPNGTAGAPYGFVLCWREPRGFVCETGFPTFAVGGVPPYAWTWAAAAGSSLPPGLRMSPTYVCVFDGLFCRTGGFISGTPTTARTYHFLLTVTDSESPPMQAHAAYAIIIATPSPSPLPSLSPSPS